MEPYPAQQAKVEHIVQHLNPKFPIFDTSKTGTGKTYTALWAAQKMGVKPFVLCPKTTISVWKQASKDLGIPMDDVMNYEKIRTGKTKRMWTKVTDTVFNGRKRRDFQCLWKDPLPQLVVFDEAHMCAGINTQLSAILIKAYHQKIPCLCMSATLADSPLKLKAFGYMMGIHGLHNYTQWLENLGCVWIERRGWLLPSKQKVLAFTRRIHHAMVLQKKMVQINTEDLPNTINAGIIIPELRTIQHVAAVQSAVKEKNYMKMRQIAELNKMEAFIEDAHSLLEEGMSVIMFVNFHASIERLSNEFRWAGVLTGKTSDDNRVSYVQAFQENRLKMLITISAVGGVSLNLHDVHGGHPRVSLISPSCNAVELIQVLGRTVRGGGKTMAIRKLIFAAGTVEEGVYKKVRAKVDRIDTLNDGDLTTFEEQQTAEQQ